LSGFPDRQSPTGFSLSGFPDRQSPTADKHSTAYFNSHVYNH
jgi:hypothetical protein